MAKKIKIKYGIEIVRPWSAEMYRHNDKVLEHVKKILFKMISNISADAAENKVLDLEYQRVATPEAKTIQKAITCYGFGHGYKYADVIEEMVRHVNRLEYWRANEIVEELDIKLDEGFVGYD